VGIVLLMLTTKTSEFPQVTQPDHLSRTLGIPGLFTDGATGHIIHWQARHTGLGL
jgi:hypothetical protein